MVAYTKPQQRKKEESKRLRGERDQIKFIDLRFERWIYVFTLALEKDRRLVKVPRAAFKMIHCSGLAVP